MSDHVHQASGGEQPLLELLNVSKHFGGVMALKNVDFTAATLTAASFKGANLEGAVLCDVDLAGVLDLTKEQLEKVKKFKTKGKVYCP